MSIRLDGTRFYRCPKCGKTEDFLVEATVSCVAYFDTHGEFAWWKEENFENPEFDRNSLKCGKCEIKPEVVEQ